MLLGRLIKWSWLFFQTEHTTIFSKRLLSHIVVKINAICVLHFSITCTQQSNLPRKSGVACKLRMATISINKVYMTLVFSYSTIVDSSCLQSCLVATVLNWKLFADTLLVSHWSDVSRARESKVTTAWFDCARGSFTHWGCLTLARTTYLSLMICPWTRVINPESMWLYANKLIK